MRRRGLACGNDAFGTRDICISQYLSLASCLSLSLSPYLSLSLSLSLSISLSPPSLSLSLPSLSHLALSTIMCAPPSATRGFPLFVMRHL